MAPFQTLLRPVLLALLAASSLGAQPPGPAGAPAQAQQPGQAPGAAATQPRTAAGQAEAAIRIIADTAIRRTDAVTIKGRSIPYRVTVGTQPVLDEGNRPIASIFYTLYERTDVGADKATRPFVISFNGGPGSASVWMHIAYTGPKVLKIDDEGYPLQPYGIQDNPHSILDVADIVYVDPVNTGFSRIIGDANRTQFFGVNEDIAYLAKWIEMFVNRHGRWTSPKYLIGESYGTTRVAGLAGRLQGQHWMYLNGVVLVSPTGLGLERTGPVRDALYLPYYAATAWYHKQLPPELQSRDLEQLLPEVEQFTINELVPALTRGGSLAAEQRQALAQRYARYSGLDERVVRQYNMAVPTQFYWKELLREEGLTVGRLDSRYRGLDRADFGTAPDFDPALTSWNHAFAPAINHYLREGLGFRTDLQYWLFGPVNPWNREGDQTGQQLQQAMGQNPFLHVMTQSGYFDGGTDYFNAKYNMWAMDPTGRFQDRLTFKGYRSGHMMYLRAEDLATSNDDIRAFIQRTRPRPDQPARR